MIQYTELLCEMAAKRRGEKMRWRVVTVLELIKAICRLLLLRLTKSRPLLSPPLPEREGDPSTLEEKDTDGLASPPSERSDETQWTMPRTGLSLPILPSSEDISSYLVSKVLTADDIKPPKALMHRVSGAGEIAEVIYIMRPVVYAMAMQYWARKNKKSWQPWVLGFTLEYGARQLAKKDLNDRRAGGMRGLTALEKEELRRRGWGLGWWVMRGAFYETFTKYVDHACDAHGTNCLTFLQGLDPFTIEQASEQTTARYGGGHNRGLRISMGPVLLSYGHALMTLHVYLWFGNGRRYDMAASSLNTLSARGY